MYPTAQQLSPCVIQPEHFRREEVHLSSLVEYRA